MARPLKKSCFLKEKGYVIFVGSMQSWKLNDRVQTVSLMLFESFTYGVMHSDGNSFFGDVVLVSFNMSYRDEESILEQKHEKQISWDLYYEDIMF